MKNKAAKTNHLIRKQAIRHYLHDKRKDTFTFMGLWNDKEPFPLAELIAVQQSYIIQLKADMGDCETLFALQEIRREETTLEQLLHKLKILQRHKKDIRGIKNR